jgi:hypothetical protein
MEPNPGGAPFALLAREEEDGLVYAGSAFVTLSAAERDRFWTTTEELKVKRRGREDGDGRPQGDLCESGIAHPRQATCAVRACSGMRA